MSETLEHIQLLFYKKEFKRKKQGGGRIQPRQDKKSFSDLQLLKLKQITESFEKDKENFSSFFDPNLIFEIVLNQNVNEEEFRKFLRRNNIDVLSPSPTGKGLWILLTKDVTFKELKKRLKDYSDERKKYHQFDAVESIQSISEEEKVGTQLKEYPLKESEEAYLDIEVWRMEDERLNKFLKGFEQLLSSKGGQVTDKLVNNDFCLLRVKINKSIFEEILKLKEICRIDRPPKPYIDFKMLTIPLKDLTVKKTPSSKATAIGIIDSGILSNHPLLEKAVGYEIEVPEKSNNKIKNPSDDVGHGTMVAGVALYGNIKRCIEERRFEPEIWILSAKVMYNNNGVAEYDPKELLEHQLEEAVTRFINNYPNCKVINLSLGDSNKRMFDGRRQFALASLIDDLAKKYNIVFVVSAGNLNPYESGFPDNYPDYLLDETGDTAKIIDPASSAYAITVGSITQEFGPSDVHPDEILISPAKQKDYPSPFTRVGPGYRGMIKPELVEEGGNIILSNSPSNQQDDIGGRLIVLNHKWIKDGRLFASDYGTSYSAPKIANYLARLFNYFPEGSPNLIKALLIASAEIPDERPDALKKISLNDSDKKLLDLLKVYGYGKPNLELAISSKNNDVLLITENRIKPDGIHMYYFYLPEEFIKESGKKEISVVLVYDPPVRRNRIDYLGIGMEFHLFKNLDVDEAISKYNAISHNELNSESEDIVPEGIRHNEIKLHPGVKIRKRGLHQKGIKIYSKQPKIDHKKPLILTVISQDKWIHNSEYLQDYAIVVRVRHKVNIYDRIKEKIREEIGIKERVKVRTA